MKCSPLHLWLGTILLTAFLTTGCQHARQSCPICGTSGPPVAAATDVSKPKGYAQSVAAPGADLPSADSAPIISTAAKSDARTAAEVSGEPTDPRSPAITRIEPGQGQPEDTTPRGEVARRTFADITAHPRFAHDPSYRWLNGTLDYSKIHNAWVLRYASVEEDDRYGGSVTLDYSGRMSSFKSGQLVRVEGQLINPESTELRPAFRVQSIRNMEP